MTSLSHTAEIDCPPATLYDYITRPWLWHEWHPNSLGAESESGELAVGDRFDERFELQPVPFLPLRIRRDFHYSVVAARPPEYWEIKASGKGVQLRFRYDFEAAGKGVRFTRRLDYELSGPMALLAPLIRRRNRRMSEIAVNRLAARFSSDENLP